jgi:hypothetical protein
VQGANWQRRHQRWMTSEKHINNDQWKHWHAHVNIQVSSNSLPSTQKPWRHIHCGGMGELFEKCWITTWSIPPLLIIVLYLWQSMPNMERWTRLVDFRQNCVKLAWVFINIMHVVHHCEILHNSSKNNIMLHLLLDKLDDMYIGVCDWGETRRLQEVTPSLYGFPKEWNATNTKKNALVDCPKIVFCLQQVRNYKFPSTIGQATHHKV